MKTLFFACAFVLPFVSAEAATPSERLRLAFLSAAEKGTEDAYVAFAAQCRENQASLNFDGDEELAKPLRQMAKTGTSSSVAAAVAAYKHCSDGASALFVRSILGNEILLGQTNSLLTGAAAAGLSAQEAELVAATEPDEYFALECKDPKCRAGRKAVFLKKAKALRLTAPTEVTERLLRAAMVRRAKEEASK